MERLIKVAIFPDNLPGFDQMLHKLIRLIPGLSFDEKYELVMSPREFIDNIFPLFDTTPNDKSAIQVALRNLDSLNPDRDYESYARNALPILKWIHQKNYLLANLLQPTSLSTNPYIFRRQWVYTLISKLDNNMRAGIEAYQAAYPFEYTVIQFINGYDPTRYDVYEPIIGNDFDLIADFIIQGSKSRGVIEQTVQMSTKNDKVNISLQRNRSGMKPDAVYDRIFEQLYIGMTEAQAFDGYCNELKLTKVEKKIRDAFKSAMKRRHNRVKHSYNQAIQKIREGVSVEEVFQHFCSEMGFDASNKETFAKFSNTINDLNF